MGKAFLSVGPYLGSGCKAAMLIDATWVCSLNVPICRSPCLQLRISSLRTPWKQQSAASMGRSTRKIPAAAQSPIETKGRKQRQTQKKMKKPRFLAEEVLPYPGVSDIENGQAFAEDEVGDDDDGDKEQNDPVRRAELKEKVSQILSNAQRIKMGLSRYPACYSLGIDFGDARSGVAISKGFAPRPVEVVELQGPKLEARLMEIALRERAVEFVVGLPKCSRGLETFQSNKTRCFAGRLAVRAAQRGWCVYLHDEFGTSNDALDYMLMKGSTRKGRRTQLDAYAAVVLLQSYFDSSGKHAELVIPKKLFLQECLCGAPIVSDLDDDGEFEDEEL